MRFRIELRDTEGTNYYSYTKESDEETFEQVEDEHLMFMINKSPISLSLEDGDKVIVPYEKIRSIRLAIVK